VFISHDDIPRTPTGKVRLFELAEMVAARVNPESKPVGCGAP
jgi:hypothetical protein